MQFSPETGLRERKKAETRLAIERAAVDIAYRQGYEAATAEAIASRAGVSLRTFFNYFPSKDLAIVGLGPVAIDEPLALRILEESEGKLLKGIACIAEACTTESPSVIELRPRRRRLVHKHPPLFHLHVVNEVKFERWLTKVVAAHLDQHPAQRRLAGAATVEEEALLAVMMVASAVHYRVRSAIESDADLTLNEELIQQTIEMMADMHRKES